MTNYQDTAVSPSGLIVPSATVTVFNAGVQSKPTIYSDQGITPLTNPFQADAQGRFKFYAANGKYDVQVSGPGIVTQTKTDILISEGQPLLVGQANLTGRVVAIASTPIYTPSSSAFYRATTLAIVTTTGTGFSITPQVTYTDADTGVFATLTHAILSASGGPGTNANSVQHFRAAPNQAISYNVNLSGPIGLGVYSFYFRLEQL